MSRKARRRQRPAHCEPGSLTDSMELGERLRLSRERLAASELAKSGQAWRLWAACADATFGYAREADTIYLTTLANLASGVHRNAAARIMRRFDELGVFVWHAAPRGSHAISELRLPPLMHSPRCMMEAHAPPTVHEGGSSCTPHGALQSNGVMHREASQPSKVGEPEGEGGPRGQAAELQSMTRDELVRLSWARPELVEAIRAEVERRATFEATFAPFEGDERTGDTTPEDEASLTRWAGANPAKARARRIRGL